MVASDENNILLKLIFRHRLSDFHRAYLSFMKTTSFFILAYLKQSIQPNLLEFFCPYMIAAEK